MHIEKLSVSNFKNLRDVSVRLGKITLLTGANSSGKSSLLASILAALQTEHFPLLYSPNGEYVNMGDFEELIYRHDQRKALGVHFVVNAGGASVDIRGDYTRNPQTRMPVLRSAEFRSPAFNLQITRGQQYNAKYAYDAAKDPRSAFRKNVAFQNLLKAVAQLTDAEIKRRARRSDRGKGKSVIPPPKWDAEPEPQGTFAFKTPADYAKVVAERGGWIVQTYFQELTGALKTFNSKFNYISSFRLAPQRTYYQVSRAALKVGRYGENCIDQISEWEALNAPEFKLLSRYLNELRLVAELETKRMSGGRFELVVQPYVRAVRSSLIDVGFGLSQFLPVVVADLQLGKGSTLAVSQPEIHLHPSVQADLADYFVARAAEGQKRYILETHSEYLINRLRLAVARRDIEESDVSVIYLRAGVRGGTKAFEIQLKKDGRIVNAPQEFFETYMIDVMDLAMTAAE